MLLNLKYTVCPETAPRFAADIVELAQQVSGVHLDYSVASLERVEAILHSFATGGVEIEQIKATLFGFGCYVGEVFVRHAGATWKELPPDDKSLPLLGWPLVVALPDGSISNPIGKVFKRMEYGEGENLPYFYRVFAKPL
jgi:hypothetical protein